MKKELTKEQIAKLSSGSCAKHIVNKFIKPETVNWARDCKVAKILYSKFPDPLFWSYIEVPENKFDAMPQLLTENSLKFLQNKYNLFKLEIPKQPEYKLEEKHGRDFLVNKEQNLIEFVG